MKIIMNEGYAKSLSIKGREAALRKTADIITRARQARTSEKTIVKAAALAIDVENDRDEIKNQISCKKGCSFCCHIKIDCTAPEAKIAFERAVEKGIVIDRQRLKLQAKTELPAAEYARALSHEDRACVFLVNNECGIYDSRPLACRSYNSINDPKFCDTSEQSFEVSRLISAETEAYQSAINTMYYGSLKSMSKHILKLMRRGI